MTQTKKTSATSVPGIRFSRKNHTVTIDLRIYGNALMDFFRAVGVEEEALQAMYGPKYNEKFVKKIKEREKEPSYKIDIKELFK